MVSSGPSVKCRPRSRRVQVHERVPHRPAVLVNHIHRAAHVRLVATGIVAGPNLPRLRIHLGNSRIGENVLTVQDTRVDHVVSNLESREPDLARLLRRHMDQGRFQPDLRFPA